jgi:hypothetical protein
MWIVLELAFHDALAKKTSMFYNPCILYQPLISVIVIWHFEFLVSAPPKFGAVHRAAEDNWVTRAQRALGKTTPAQRRQRRGGQTTGETRSNHVINLHILIAQCVC